MDQMSMEFTEDQKKCLNEVVRALNDDNDIEDIEKKIHNASVSLIRHMDYVCCKRKGPGRGEKLSEKSIDLALELVIYGFKKYKAVSETL